MRARALVVILLAAACHRDGPTAPAPATPEVVASAVAANPHNVLSAVVSAEVRLADSVAVRYGITGEPLASATPAVVPRDGVATVPVLGLLPQTPYTLQVTVHGDGRVVVGDSLTLQTGALPADLPAYLAEGADPTPGYVAFAAGGYGLVIDNAGRVVWYRHFPAGAGLNFQPQPTGHYVARPPAALPGQPARWVEIDPLGNQTRTLGCAGGLQARFHDLLLQPDGGYWIMCDEDRTVDLSGLGGVADARVTGTVIQHLSATGALRFQWSPFDHFAITDLPLADRTGALVNWTHGNALDLDAEGYLLVSFRALSEVTRIDPRTGAVVWRMGGLRNQFTFAGGPAPAFASQHGLREVAPGQLLLLDNLGDPLASRAERFAYDAPSRTVELVASWGSLPPVTALLGGTTQALPGGRLLVSFGSAGRVEEYDAAGGVVWRLRAPGYVFRAHRIHSLYRPGAGSAR